jgi:transcriptional regulator with XRE-family HTH domain
LQIVKPPTNRLRVVRAEKRVTQEQIETRTKRQITQSRVSLIENGQAEATDAEKRLIARALRASVQEVFPEPPTELSA